MKKLWIVAFVFIGLQVTAQESETSRKNRPDFTAEEMANLELKKLTLALDLTNAQQNKIAPLLLESAKDRKEKRAQFEANKEKNERPNKETHLKMLNERLDKQIAMKRKMRDILTDAQYERFEKIHQRRKDAKPYRGKMHKRPKMEKRGMYDKPLEKK